MHISFLSSTEIRYRNTDTEWPVLGNYRNTETEWPVFKYRMPIPPVPKSTESQLWYFHKCRSLALKNGVIYIRVPVSCAHKGEINPRPDVGLSHIRPEGGSKWPHFLTQKLRGIERHGKNRSIALNEYLRKHFQHFFAQVNIEVTRGHQMSNLAECHIIFRKSAIISESNIRSRPRKKTR